LQLDPGEAEEGVTGGAATEEELGTVGLVVEEEGEAEIVEELTPGAIAVELDTPLGELLSGGRLPELTPGLGESPSLLYAASQPSPLSSSHSSLSSLSEQATKTTAAKAAKPKNIRTVFMQPPCGSYSTT
jgi:hypothetical protein